MLDYEFHPEARRELAEELKYLTQIDQTLTPGFGLEIEAAITLIRTQPELFRLRKNHRRINLQRFSFYLPFNVIDDTVFIYAIAHSARRPGYWKKRLSS